MRARERVAAERAARKRAEARRRLLVPIAAVTAVLAIVVALVAVKLTAGPAHLVASEAPASAAVVRQVSSVPAAVLASVDPGQAITSLEPVKTSGPPLTIGGKPAIVFVSEESCPFCAAERWPVAVALSHFGTLSDLGTTSSSATDVYPDTATLSFRTVRYQSAELTLRTTELADNAGRPLQPQTALDTGRRDLEGWLAVVEADDQSGLRSFAAGIRNDMPAVINGLTLHYSSATMEGNASKIILSNQNCQIDPEGLHATRSRVPG
jgi:hypothetical protein